ncbi:hypothetical protein BG015_005476 [Linnemannia schmuckeri]|uniref:Uncharacterized protein n=1 Tax=Linnemannia schmuckeri TaxID=64567 RepID=A0A9P5R416_9FUNG|nr:hypothetical protein BG015_005476 [Linnemannia schmuckeri]
MHSSMPATNKAQPIADFPNTQVHNLKDDSTSDTPIHMHPHTAAGPIPSAPVDVEPIHSTGLDSTASKTGYRAKEADLHATSGVPASKVDVHPTTKLNQGYNTHHSTTATDSRPSTTDIDARPSTTDIDARPSTTSTSTTNSRPLTEKVTAPVVGAASAVGTAAADTAAYLGNKASEAKESVKETVSNLTTSSSSDTPSSTTSHATMDSARGIYNPSVSSSASYNSAASTTPMQPYSTHTTTHHTSSSTPLTEKVKAPVVGAASALGAAAVSTAAYLGDKASEAKGTFNKKDTSTDKTPNVTHNNNNNNNTYSTSTPMDKNTTYPHTTKPDAKPVVAEPAIAHSPTLDTFQTKIAATNPSSSTDSSKFTTPSSRPMTEKASAPVVGAAAAGTAAYLGHKATSAENSAHNVSAPSNNTHNTTSYNNTAPTSYTSSHNNNAAPTSFATSSNTNIPAHEKTSTTTPYPSTATTHPYATATHPSTATTHPSTATTHPSTATTHPSTATTHPSTATTHPSTTTTSGTAPIMAAATAPHMTNTHQTSATPTETKAADTNAAGIPASYHGSVPKAGPGEEVVWVKTVTTTDYYDDGTSTGRADVVDRHQEPIDPKSYATVKEGQTVYNNNDQRQNQEHHSQEHHSQEHMNQEHMNQRGAGRHL